jgi:hypothetical protein
MGSSPEPVVPAYCRLRMPRKRPRVLGVDLNCSESRYRLAGNALATARPEGLYLGLQPLGAWSSAPSDPAPLAAAVDAIAADPRIASIEPLKNGGGLGHGRSLRIELYLALDTAVL